MIILIVHFVLVWEHSYIAVYVACEVSLIVPSTNRLLFAASTGRSPLHYAASNGYLKAVRWLVEEADATAGLQTKKGHTARLLAKKHGHSKVAIYLAEVGKDA